MTENQEIIDASLTEMKTVLEYKAWKLNKKIVSSERTEALALIKELSEIENDKFDEPATEDRWRSSYLDQTIATLNKNHYANVKFLNNEEIDSLRHYMWLLTRCFRYYNGNFPRG